MIDPVTAALVQRQRFEPGVVAGLWTAVIGHLLIACVMLAASARSSPVIWKVVPVIPLPLGELSGGITPARSGDPDLSPELVRRQPSPARAKGLPLPSKTAVRNTESAIGPGSEDQLESGPGQASAITVGDPLGDTGSHSWYLAGVRSKIWSIWAAEIRSSGPGAPQVEFTILRDGSLASVDLVQSSGDRLLDMAATRAVYSVGPFAPIPRDAGRDEMRVRAIFRPSS